MEIKKLHFAPNGYLHVGSIVTLADTIAGYACLYNLPDKGISFDETHQTLNLRSASDFANQLNVNHLNRTVKESTEKTTSQIIAERIFPVAGS